MDGIPLSGKRVAFFGGSFDPPHQGHLAVAEAARQALALDQVLFAPVGAQPLKPQGPSASFADRVQMTRLAIADHSGFALSLLDAPRSSGAPNYTINTLLRLREDLASGGELFCLMGADSYLSLRHWHRAAEIPFVASLIVASRPGQPLDDLRSALPAGLAMGPCSHAELAGLARVTESADLRVFLLRNEAGSVAPMYWLPGLHVDISASQARRTIGDGPLQSPERDALLPASVAAYILAQGLYR